MKVIKSVHLREDVKVDEAPRRSTKLTPNKKSGKQRHQLYQSLEQEDDDLDDFLVEEKESIFDYLDDDDDLEDDE